jgi:hypothetical protein
VTYVVRATALDAVNVAPITPQNASFDFAVDFICP